MFNKLDIYIMRKFLGAFVFAIMLFTSVAVVIDLTEKIKNILENKVPLGALITEYYLMFIPWIDALLTPLFVVMAVIFFTSRLASRTEIVAMLATGVSFYRVMVPYLASAFLIAVGLYAANNYIVPYANEKRLAFEYAYINKPHKRYNKDVHLQIQPTEYIYMENYSNTDSTGYKFAYEVIVDGKLQYKLRADRIQWNGSEKTWTIRNFIIREFKEDREVVTTGISKDTVFNFQPRDLEERVSLKEEMTTPELKAFIETMRLRGADNVEHYLIELYRRSADPVTVIILTIIGLALSSRKVRGGIGVHIVLGLLISGAFIIFSQFSVTFSTNGGLHPFLGVWIPNFVFAFVAAFLIWRAPK